MKKILFFVILFLVGLSSQAVEKTLKFVQISDVHFAQNRTAPYPYRLFEESGMLFQDSVDNVNSLKNIDFVMFTGDQTDTGKKEDAEEFERIKSSIKLPTYSVRGNHDANLSKSYYAFTPKQGFRAIVLDSNMDGKKSANGKIDEKQVEWFKSELEKNKNDVVLIFVHHPVKAPFPRGYQGMYIYDHSLLNSKDIETILKGYKNPIAVFSGHYHAAKITQDGNILYSCAPSLISYPNAFRAVKIVSDDEKTKLSFYFKETRLKKVQVKAKKLLPHFENYEGGRKDRSGAYVIKLKH